MSLETLPVVVWLGGMLLGFAYTAGAAKVAVQDVRRERGTPLLEDVARRNRRSELLRCTTLACFVLAGMLSLDAELDPPFDVFSSWQHAAVVLLLLIGGLGVVANSVLDARYRARLRAAILRGEIRAQSESRPEDLNR